MSQNFAVNANRWICVNGNSLLLDKFNLIGNFKQWNETGEKWIGRRSCVHPVQREPRLRLRIISMANEFKYPVRCARTSWHATISLIMWLWAATLSWTKISFSAATLLFRPFFTAGQLGHCANLVSFIAVPLGRNQIVFGTNFHRLENMRFRPYVKEIP